MAIQYKVFANDLAGGPVDYSTPIATVSGLSYSPAALAPNSDATFAVRSYDTVTGLDDGNVDARIRIITDAGGNDISGRPDAACGISAIATAGGGARIDWTFVGTAPVGFKVWHSSGVINFASPPTATIPAFPGVRRYAAALSGLSDGVTYNVAVRAYNAIADGIEVSTTVVGSSAGPAAADSVAAVASF